MGSFGRSVALVLLALALVGAVFATAVLAAVEGDGEDAGAACTPVGVAPAGPTAGLDAEQTRNVAIIVAVGDRLQVPLRADVVAVATAMQESSLRNLRGGDRDSAGLFQQRPSQGWGSLVEITDPSTSAARFFRALLAVPDWEQLPLTAAAQRVQRSAFPGAYTRWERLANVAVGAAAGIRCRAPGVP